MTDYLVEIQDEYGGVNFPTQRVRDAIHNLLKEHQVQPGTGLTIVLTGDERVQRLNAQYRGVDSPTDVLSFPAESPPAEFEGEPPYLGDLIIAFPYTARHAEEAGHSLDDEFVLLAIHGTLHLLGYDHDNAESQEAMWAKQEKALAAAGVAIEVPRFTFGDERGS
jgi:probable rRNA maturation factor